MAASLSAANSSVLHLDVGELHYWTIVFALYLDANFICYWFILAILGVCYVCCFLSTLSLLVVLKSYDDSEVLRTLWAVDKLLRVIIISRIETSNWQSSVKSCEPKMWCIVKFIINLYITLLDSQQIIL